MFKYNSINRSQSNLIGNNSIIKLLLIAFIALVILSCSSDDTTVNYDAPKNLEVTKILNGKVKLTWEYSSQTTDVIYIIARKVGAGPWNEYYGQTTSDTKEFFDDIPTISYTLYSYKVKAQEVETENESFFSEASAYFSEITQPTELSINQIGQNQIELTWKDNVIGEVGYKIDKRINNGSWTTSYATLAENTQTYTDEVTQLYQTITYRIYAFVGNSNSPTNEISFTPTIELPDSLQVNQISQNQVRLTWQNSDEIPDNYSIQRRIGTNDWSDLDQVSGSQTTYVDNLSIESATLSYRIRSERDTLYSAYTEPVSINLNIVELGYANLINQGNQVFAKDNYIYIANDYNGALIYDVSNPTNPNLIKNIPMPGRTLSVTVDDNYLYMANDQGILQVYNISNLDNIVKVYDDIQFYGQGNYIKIGYINSHKYALIASGSSGVKIIDLDTLPIPFVLKTINTVPNGNAFKIIYSDNILYIAEGINGIRKFNISDPLNPDELQHKTSIGAVVDIALGSQMLYAARGDLGIAVFDKSDLSLVSEYDTQGYSNSIDIDSRNIYIADRDNGFMMVSVINPYNLYSLYQLPTDNYIISVAMSTKYAYVLSQNQLKIIQIRP